MQPAAEAALQRIAHEAGELLRDEQMRRGWTLRQLADRAGTAAAVAHNVEAGGIATLETYARLATALGVRPEFALVDPRTRRAAAAPRLDAADFVHAAIAERAGIGPRGWRSVTHVMAGLWSSEVLHAIRLRRATFAAQCPDRADAVTAWLEGDRPPPGSTSMLVVLDPAVPFGSRRRTIASVSEPPILEPRYRDDADAAETLRRAIRRG